MITVKLVCDTRMGKVYLYEFTNKFGSRMTVTNYGATIVSIEMPDRYGVLGDIVLGHDEIEAYFSEHSYLGSTIGRYANRIKNGQFVLNGHKYDLTKNEGKNHLHGGSEGFNKKLWHGEITGDLLVMQYTSPDGEEGYPGNLDAVVSFSLTNENVVCINYSAECDEDTIVNFTNHTYFNLSDRSGDVTEHILRIDAGLFTPTDKEAIPTGEIASVEKTPLDFRLPQKIGERIRSGFLSDKNGYDHNFVLNGNGFRQCADLTEPASGRKMIVYTDQPGLQLYTAQNMAKKFVGKNNRSYDKHCGVCLETQNFPDTPNNENFSSAVLRAGDTYAHHTRYVFSTI